MAEQKDDKKTAFGELVMRIMEETVKSAEEPPGVRASVVEWYGKKMASLGYEMSEWSVGVLADYLKGYNLWLCGKVGVGKTFFFDVMSKIRVEKHMEPIAKLSMIETQGWSMEDARNWADGSRDVDVLIDDVGTEPVEMVSYGQKIDLFPYLLEKRMQLTTRRTHLTSNLGVADINKRYGLRVADRFVQFFKMCKCPDKGSRRKPAPWRRSRNGEGVP